MRRVVLVAAGWFTMAAGLDRTSAQPLPAEFVSIAPNSGKSAGGHCGLRLGDQVFHYGVESGLLLVKRDPWDDFVRRYRMLDNRRIDLIRYDLDAEAARRIKVRFDRLYLVQETHRDRLRVLELEHDWFGALAAESGPRVMLAGAGFFDPKRPGSIDFLPLQKAISERHGQRFLEESLAEVEAEIRNCALEVSRPGNGPLEIDRFPAPGELAGHRLRDRLRIREALRILIDGRALDSEAVRVLGGTTLWPRERRELQTFAARFETSVCRLLNSTRPDRGGALLLGTARYLAARRSLADNRWVLLDVINEDAEILLEARPARRHRDLLHALSFQAGKTWERVRTGIFSDGGTLNQLSIHALEAAASQVAGIEDALRRGGDLRLPAATGAGRSLPRRAGEIALPELSLPPGAAEAARRTAGENLRAARRAIIDTYDYALLSRNCATELAAAIRAAFPDGPDPETWFGALPEKGERLTFIPVAMRNYLSENSRIVETRSLPSWRHERMAREIAESPDREKRIRRRESNTVTSTIYQGSIRDDAFLLFSDGPKVLRPLKGAVNLGYGLGTGSAGLLTLPFDGGDRARSGFRGAFHSLPELIGFGIRKGRFDVVPLDTEENPSRN